MLHTWFEESTEVIKSQHIVIWGNSKEIHTCYMVSSEFSDHLEVGTSSSIFGKRREGSSESLGLPSKLWGPFLFNVGDPPCYDNEAGWGTSIPYWLPVDFVAEAKVSLSLLRTFCRCLHLIDLREINRRKAYPFIWCKLYVPREPPEGEEDPKAAYKCFCARWNKERQAWLTVTQLHEAAKGKNRILLTKPVGTESSQSRHPVLADEWW